MRPYSKKAETGSDLQAAFEYHVQPEPNSGCWLWLGPILQKRGNYGVFTARPFGYIMARAHRVAWEIYRGKIRNKKKNHVLHSCDNVLCVNPDHLFLGTQADNMRDKCLKGRQNQGENHNMFKHGRYIGDKQNPEYHPARVHP